MRSFRTARLATAAAAAFIASITAPAAAQALTSPEIECRQTIARSMAAYTRAALRTTKKCHRHRSSGRQPLSLDCNDAQAADFKNKLGTYRTQVTARIAGPVSPCTEAPALLTQYPSCPAPAQSSDDGGTTTGIDSYGEVAACLIALTDAEVGALAAETSGHPQTELSADVYQCQTVVSEGVKRIVKRILRGRRICQNALDDAGGGADYACDGQDPDGRIAQARTQVASFIGISCNLPQNELDALHACGDTTAELQQCVVAAADEAGSTLIEKAYELPGAGTTTTTAEPPTTTLAPTTTTVAEPTTTLSETTTTLPETTTTIAGPTTTLSPTTTTLQVTTTTLPELACGETLPLCSGSCGDGQVCESVDGACQCVAGAGDCAPATIRRVFKGKYGTPPSRTSLSTGWSGTAHDVDIPDLSRDVVDVTCDDSCQSCDVSLNVQEGSATSNCRCAAAPQTTCTVINGPDPASCGAVSPGCQCFFGSPLAISAGGTPVCVVNQITEDYSGTMNLRTGEWFESTKLASVVHLGADVFNPCPVCKNDPVPNDGVRGGTCDGGLQNGSGCDVNGIHRTFGATSFDCPPPTVSNISGSGLLLDLEFTTGTRMLDANLPCTEPGDELCPCRVCSGNNRVGCASNADCAEVAAGTCTAAGGAGAQPNECTDFDCGKDGFCTIGPVDTYCDGVTHADGRGFITCLTDVDCQGLGAGSCSVQDLRRCFTDPIQVAGDPDVESPVKSSIFCIPPTTNPAVNSSSGLPGPGTFTLDFDADVRCQNDPALAYQFPSGANCSGGGTTTTTDPTGTTLPPTTLPDTTTTTVPPLACAQAAPPLCAGVCGVGQLCVAGLGGCQCGDLQ